MQITVAAKRIDEKWEAALIIEGRFTRALVEKSLSDLVAKAVGPILSAPLAEGSEVAINIAILTAEEMAAQAASANRPKEKSSANALRD